MPLLLWTVSTLASLLLLTSNVCDQAEPSPAIVRIVAQGCAPENHERSQTGFIVLDPPQLSTPSIATALHGVANCTTITAIANSTVISDLQITQIDFQRDVALLALAAEQQALIPSTYLTATHEPIPTDTTGKPEAVCAVGYPAGIKDQWSYRALRLQSRTKAKLYNLLPPDQELINAFNQRQSPSRFTNVFRIEGELAHGVSGAPLLNEAGAVIGIIEGGLKDAGADTVSWAIPWADIQWETADSEILSSLEPYDPRLVFAVNVSPTIMTPTPTLTPSQSQQIPLKKGNFVQVTWVHGIELYDLPGEGSSGYILSQHQIAQIIDGPRGAWWKVRVLDNNQEGWITPTVRAGALLQPLPNLIVGGWVQVITSVRLEFREFPGIQSRLLDEFDKNDIVEVMAGPQEKDGMLWWQFRPKSSTLVGWTPSAGNGGIYLDPVTVQIATPVSTTIHNDPVPSAVDVLTVTPTSSAFIELRFCYDYEFDRQNNHCTTSRSTFNSQTKMIYLSWNIPDKYKGASFKRIWYLDGIVFLTTENNNQYAHLEVKNRNTLKSGNYTLELYAYGTLVQKGSFTIK
jgi:hypothetical protein